MGPIRSMHKRRSAPKPSTLSERAEGAQALPPEHAITKQHAISLRFVGTQGTALGEKWNALPFPTDSLTTHTTSQDPFTGRAPVALPMAIRRKVHENASRISATHPALFRLRIQTMEFE